VSEKKPNLLDWLGYRRSPDFSTARSFGAAVGILLAGLAVLIIGATLLQFLRAVLSIDSFAAAADKHAAIRNTGLVVAALLGVPFVIWRSVVAQKQVDVAEQGLITDRLTKAVEGLGAMKTVKRQRRDENGNPLYSKGEDGEPDPAQPLTEDLTEPNIEVRIGALYALERISKDSDRDHVNTMEILCAYIRENAPEKEARTTEQDGITPLEDLPKEANDEERSTYLEAIEARTENLQAWARNLPPPRSDIRVALEVIGRRAADRIALEQADGYRPGLRKTNLQGAELERARLEGANLGGAHLEGADLEDADLEGASLRGAHLEGADLEDADLEGANLSLADLDNHTSFTAATLRGAAVKDVDFTPVTLDQAQIESTFGDDSTKLGQHERPSHWPSANLDWPDFHKEWHLYLANPASYVPPQDRA